MSPPCTRYAAGVADVADEELARAAGLVTAVSVVPMPASFRVRRLRVEHGRVGQDDGRVDRAAVGERSL